jgi:hypothetical protein
MDGNGENHVKQSKPNSNGQKLHVFLSHVEIRPTNVYINTYMILCMYTHTHTHTHTHTYTERENKIVLVCLFEMTTGGRRGRKNVRGLEEWLKQ